MTFLKRNFFSSAASDFFMLYWDQSPSSSRVLGNGSNFCTPVLMNMTNITFQVLRLSSLLLSLTSVQKKRKIIFVVKSLKGFG